MSDWNPKDYLGFAAEQAQPAIDLIARLPNRAPKVICDLGCGPGNSTALLQRAFPASTITGVDSSAAMLAVARHINPSVGFVEADAAHWLPGIDTDLVFSNALFQWLSNRDDVIRSIFAALKGGAALALQMPDNLNEPSHFLMREVAVAGPWKDKLSHVSPARPPLLDERGHYDLLQPLSQVMQIW